MPDDNDREAWHELLTRQGHDLDQVRRELAEANARVGSLENELGRLKEQVRGLKRDRGDLATALERATAVVSRMSSESTHEHEP